MLRDQVVEDLAGGGRDGIDMVEVTILGVGDVVVDIDPELGFGSGVQGIVSEAWLGGAVEGDGDLNIEGFCGWRLNFVTTGKEGQIVGGAVFVDVVHGFTHLLEGVTEGDLGANGVTIRANMAEDDKGIVGTDGVGYFLEGIVFNHTVGTCGWGGFRRNQRN